jgi:hypothetical protein
MESEHTIEQNLIVDAFIDALCPEDIWANVRSLALSTVEAGVGTNPAEARKNKVSVARGESDDVRNG